MLRVLGHGHPTGGAEYLRFVPAGGVRLPAAPSAYDCAGVPRKGGATVADGGNDAAAGVEGAGVGPFVTGVLSAKVGLPTLLMATMAPAKQARTTTVITQDHMRRRVDRRGERGGVGGSRGSGGTRRGGPAPPARAPPPPALVGVGPVPPCTPPTRPPPPPADAAPP